MIRFFRAQARPLSVLALTGFVGQTLLVCCIALSDTTLAASPSKSGFDALEADALCSTHTSTQAVSTHAHIDVSAAPAGNHRHAGMETPLQGGMEEACENTLDTQADCCYFDDEPPVIASHLSRSAQFKNQIQHPDSIDVILPAAPITSQLYTLFNTPPPVESSRIPRSSPIYLAFCSFLE